MEVNYLLSYSIAGLTVGTFALAIAIMLYLQKRDARSSKRK